MNADAFTDVTKLRKAGFDGQVRCHSPSPKQWLTCSSLVLQPHLPMLHAAMDLLAVPASCHCMC